MPYNSEFADGGKKTNLGLGLVHKDAKSTLNSCRIPALRTVVSAAYLDAFFSSVVCRVKPDRKTQQVEYGRLALRFFYLVLETRSCNFVATLRHNTQLPSEIIYLFFCHHIYFQSSKGALPRRASCLNI